MLPAKAEAIANEAEDEKKGVTEWRRESIKKLLKDKEGKLVPVSAPPPPPRKLIPVNSQQVDKMIEAKRLLDEHYDNVYQRLAILKTRLTLLFFLGLAFLGLWFVVLPPVPLG